jgi:lipopolysaccharide transport system ATP-binding protein
MADALQIESLGKYYRLGELPSTRAGEALQKAIGAPVRRLRGAGRKRARGEEGFWALRDVNLSIASGEALGIVGSNGAGKSTLLKLVARITPPTEGRIVLHGRVGTLLEVGTGFHPDLSGRENIFLNGAILGMGRKEISRKYEEIVEFAGVERFLETPVKRYSSGMYVRLAFAVAAHLEPEILLVDEVLAVGDAEFQRKCIGKMRDVAGEGRTVVFVSHNLGAVQRLCDRAVLVEAGNVVLDESPEAVVADYLHRTAPGLSGGVMRVPEDIQRNGTGEARLAEISVTDLEGRPLAAMHLGQAFRIRAIFDVVEDIDDAVVEFGLSVFGGERVVTVQSTDRDRPLLSLPKGRVELEADVQTSMLPGEFAVDAAVHHATGVTADHVQDVMRITALNASEDGDDHYRWSVVRGYVRPESSWSEVRVAGSSQLPSAG